MIALMPATDFAATIVIRIRRWCSRGTLCRIGGLFLATPSLGEDRSWRALVGAGAPPGRHRPRKRGATDGTRLLGAPPPQKPGAASAAAATTTTTTAAATTTLSPSPPHPPAHRGLYYYYYDYYIINIMTTHLAVIAGVELAGLRAPGGPLSTAAARGARAAVSAPRPPGTQRRPPQLSFYLCPKTSCIMAAARPPQLGAQRRPL